MNNIVGEDMSDAIAALAEKTSERIRLRMLVDKIDAELLSDHKDDEYISIVWFGSSTEQKMRLIQLAEKKSRDQNTSYIEDTTS